MTNQFIEDDKESFTRCCVCDIPDFMATEMHAVRGKNYCEKCVPEKEVLNKLRQRYIELTKESKNKQTFFEN